MLRILLGLFISVSVARWMYSEVELVAPPLMPVLDYVVDATTIPTHDKWSKDSLESLLKAVDTVAKVCVSSFMEQKQTSAPKNTKEKRRSPSPTVTHTNQQLAALEAGLGIATSLNPS